MASSRFGRLWSFVLRARWRTKLGVREILVAVLAGVIYMAESQHFGWRLDLRPELGAALSACLAVILLWVGEFLGHLVQIWRDPSYHPNWKSVAYPGNSPTMPMVVFELESRIGFQVVHDLGCEVRVPNGVAFWEDTPSNRPARPATSFNFTYGNGTAFPSAPPPVTGLYEIRWFERGKKGGWREILRHSKEISLLA